MMKKNILCIEFIGIFGSGKTTLINETYKLLSKEGISVVRGSDYFLYKRVKRFTKCIHLLLLHPLYLFKLLLFFIKLFFTIKPSGKVETDIFKTLIKIHLVKNYLLINKSPNVLLIEGAYHLLPIFKKMKKLTDKDLFFAKHTLFNYHKSYFVYLDVDAKIAHNRVLDDHKNNFRRFSDVELNNLKKRYDLMIDNQIKLKNSLQKKYIIHIDGRKSIKYNANNLSNQIRRLLI